MGWLAEGVRRAFRLWLSHRLPPCEEVTRLVSEGMDRDLRFGERMRMRMHLRMCAWCRRYFAQVHLIHEEAQALAEPIEDPTPVSEAVLSPEARRRIERLLAG